MKKTDTLIDYNNACRENGILQHILPSILIAAVFIGISPFVFSSEWVSSSDFHACIEMTSSFIAIIAGISCIVYYFGMKSRYFLIIGLGFFISGSEDFIHGLFAFKRLFEGTGVDFSRYIPGTYVTGRILLAVCIIVAEITDIYFRTIKTKRLKSEAVISTAVALVIGGGMTMLAFSLPLPKFIYPDNMIARPVDFISAILFVIAFVFTARRLYKCRDIFSGMLLACILLNAGGQIYMSFSKKLFDIFFDIAHWANILSYCTPVLGIVIEFFYKNNEVASQLKTIHKASEALKEIVEQVRDTTDRLTTSSEDLSAVSAQMTSSAEETNIQASSVAATSEQVAVSVDNAASLTTQLNDTVSDIATMTGEMTAAFEKMVNFSQQTSENVKNMACSGDDISAGIHSTASAIEEMTISLNEVAKHTTQASQVSRHASRRTEEINTKMDALVKASKKIGKIVSVIRGIADQTNMLALNATIEAAGAGDAGKGFAVVASEVKVLAKQSADASDEISEQIEQIQERISEVVSTIGEVSEIINKIADINESIAGSAEDQTTTANEISEIMADNVTTVKNVARDANESARLVAEIAKSTAETSETAKDVATHIDGMAKGVESLARSAGNAAMGVRDISDNIQGVSVASKETATGATRTNDASAELAKIATTLSKIIQRFDA